MEGDPALREQPEDPGPRVLVRDEVHQEVVLRGGALEVEVVRQVALERERVSKISELTELTD